MTGWRNEEGEAGGGRWVARWRRSREGGERWRSWEGGDAV